MYVTLGHFVSSVYCQTGSPSYGYVVMCRLMLSFTGSEKKKKKKEKVKKMSPKEKMTSWSSKVGW